MSRVCLAFVFALASLLALSAPALAQTNSEKSSQMPGPAPEPPAPPKVAKDSLKAAKAKAKASKKAKATGKDSAQAASPAVATAKDTIAPAAAVMPATPAAPVAAPAAPSVPVPAAGASEAASPAAAPVDSVQASASDTAKPSISMTDESKPAPARLPPDFHLINDPPLIAKEYGFGILGSLVAGTLGFYIGSGIETAFQGEDKAHKGTLGFTGIRYDNYYGAFWGGATGMVFGSALTTYFVGQTDEEDGGFLMTLAGAAAATGGALYAAHLVGVNDDIDWKPFIPLLAIPSLGSTLGFNVSRWLSDRKREEIVGKEASIHWHPPRLAWGKSPGGDRLEISALNLSF